MKTNVGNLLQSAATSTLIAVWLNDAYKDISRRCLWSALIDDDYTFDSVASTATVSLEADFDEEIFVADIANGHALQRMTEGMYWEDRNSAYTADAVAEGNPLRYVILREGSVIKLDPTPDTAETYAMPYKKLITDLSTDASTTAIKDIEIAMEMYAVAQGWMYDKQFQKADYYLQRYEYELNKRIAQERSKINQRYQFKSASYTTDRPRYLTGETSYDTV